MDGNFYLFNWNNPQKKLNLRCDGMENFGTLRKKCL